MPPLTPALPPGPPDPRPRNPTSQVDILVNNAGLALGTAAVQDNNIDVRDDPRGRGGRGQRGGAGRGQTGEMPGAGGQRGEWGGSSGADIDTGDQ